MQEWDTKVTRNLEEFELGLCHDLTLRLGAMLVIGMAGVAALLRVL